MALNMSDQKAIIANVLDIQIDLESIKYNMDSMFLVINGIIVTCKYIIMILIL